MSRSWKVAIMPVREREWLQNSMRFPNKEDALVYARDLQARYPEMVRWGVFESEDAPNTELRKTVLVLFSAKGEGGQEDG